MCCALEISLPVRASANKNVLDQKPFFQKITYRDKQASTFVEPCLSFGLFSSASQQQDNVSNMKRENKLYSYQDQLAELEIRKELEEKKRAKGLIKAEPVKLTKKQQELVDATMKTEAEIRGRMKEVRTRTFF